MIENRDEHAWCLPSVSLPSNATPCMLGSPTLATCRCRAATVFTYLLTYSEFGIVVEHVSQTGSFERLLKIVSCGKGWSVRPVYARAPARRAEERHINAGRPATPEHETQRAVTRRSARIIRRAARARVARLALGFANRRGRRGGRGRVDALVHVRTPIRGSGTHSFLDSSHVRSVTASYCHSPTTAGRLSR